MAKLALGATVAAKYLPDCSNRSNQGDDEQLKAKPGTEEKSPEGETTITNTAKTTPGVPRQINTR